MIKHLHYIFLITCALPYLGSAIESIDRTSIHSTQITLDKGLIGNWFIHDKPTNIKATLNLHENGNFSGQATKAGQIIWNYSGKWWLEGNILKYKYLKSDRLFVKPGFLDSDTVLEVNQKQLKLKQMGGHRDGEIMIYMRNKG